MTTYIVDIAHYNEVLARVASVRHSLVIGTADIKDLYVKEVTFLSMVQFMTLQTLTASVKMVLISTISIQAIQYAHLLVSAL